ncbi:phosphoribosyltransferase (plasmid) [Sinorhizobium meliloti]|uniref:phosphoribosyltransferase n=1 Tax=Rhizobium meliloti TaxID=382 RepID=UPI00299CD52A|nr:hypothetical protein [Sinorhizobium meliloti]
MIGFNSKAGWMEFPYLTVSSGLTKTYALAYKLTDNTGEKWTSRCIRFKNKDSKAFYGGARLLYAAFPPLLAAMELEGKGCAFVCALSSSETVADPDRQIPFITSELAAIVGAHSSIAAVSKQAHNKLHNLYKADQRDAELEKAQYACGVLPAQNVFVFDDFVTRGGTLSRVARAIKTSNPEAMVYGVALAKTERVNYCPHPDNGHVPQQWDKIWTDGENEVA